MGEVDSRMDSLDSLVSAGRHARIATTDLKQCQPATVRQHSVQFAQELEEKAQSAAVEYLDRRKKKISELQKVGQQRVSVTQASHGGKTGLPHEHQSKGQRSARPVPLQTPRTPPTSARGFLAGK